VSQLACPADLVRTAAMPQPMSTPTACLKTHGKAAMLRS